MCKAYDLDGTLTEENSWPRIDPLMLRWFGTYWSWFKRRKKKCIFHPVRPEFFVITGRPEADRWFTEKWLKKHFPTQKVTLLMYPDSDECYKCMKVAKWKFDMICKNNITEYFDDSDHILSYLASQKQELSWNLRLFKATDGIFTEFVAG